MKTIILEHQKIFCYLVMIDDGFCMEPDVSVSKVFLSFNRANEYLKKIKDKHRFVYIERKEIER